MANNSIFTLPRKQGGVEGLVVSRGQIFRLLKKIVLVELINPKLLPKNVFHIFQVNVHSPLDYSYVTHQQDKLHTYECRTYSAQKAIRLYSVILWNEFSSTV